MWKEDLLGSIAYAKAIQKVGILTPEESASIISGLEKVMEEWASNTFEIKSGDEDIHTANERRLTEIIGPLGGKLHTGRSCNNQVATDTRLWIVQAKKDILKDMATLLQASAEFCKVHIDVLMAGYTHLQPAQPIRFSHWLMSHMAALMRDAKRLGREPWRGMHSALIGNFWRRSWGSRASRPIRWTASAIAISSRSS